MTVSRERLADILRQFHRNACYPNAMSYEVETAVDQLEATLRAAAELDHRTSVEWKSRVDEALQALGTATTETHIDPIRRADAHMKVANFLHSIRASQAGSEASSGAKIKDRPPHQIVIEDDAAPEQAAQKKD